MRKYRMILALAALGLVALASADAGHPHQPLLSQDPEPPERIAPGKLCMDCHQDVGNKAVVHRPVRWNHCQLCHLQTDPTLHTFRAPASMGEVCKECHLLPERQSFHEPVKAGDCLSCHVPHQSDRRSLLKLPTEKALCGQCHPDQVGVQKEFIHGPVAVGACSLCHLSHSSNEPRLLRKAGSQACLDCHADMQARLKGAEAVHTPVGQDCALCHDPHASDHRFQLKSPVKTLCMDCHQPMLDALKAMPVFHEALNTEEGCLHCHDVHSSPYPNNLKAPVRELCMSCHAEAIVHEDGTQLPGMGETMKSTHLHGPIREGNCEACHDPHGSLTFSLLRDAYPERFYAPYTRERYALCYRCHDSGAFELVQTENLTGFRNGKRNLHFLHVNDKNKGRTCRACHETHGSEDPLHLRESVPFGNWELPINFTKTVSGGSCAPGCHAPKAYDRLNPVKHESTSLLSTIQQLPKDQ